MKQSLYRNIIIIFSILAFWLGVIPLVFSRAIPIVCENLSYNTEYNILVEKPVLYMNIVPIMTIKANKVRIESKDKQEEYLVDNLKIKLRILPLLSGHVHINSIQASNIVVNSTLENKFELDKSFAEKIKNTKIICDCIDFRNIKLNINNKEVEQNIICVAEKIFYKKNGKYLKFETKGSININNIFSEADVTINLPKNNDINKSIIDVKIKNFDISAITNYLKNYLPSDLVRTNGIINLNITKKHLIADLKDFQIIMQDDAKSMIFPDKLNIVSDLNLTRKTIHIDNAEIKSKNIDTVINGTISNYLGKLKPELDLKIRINKSKIEDFIGILPPFKCEDLDAYKLKKYKFYGDIIANFAIKGSLPEPSLNGGIYVNNGILTRPIPNAKGATIKFDLNGKLVNFDILVPAGNGEKVQVKGSEELYNVKYSELRVWSTKNVNLKVAEEKVVSIHEILNFVIGPVPIMNIDGVGNIDITIKGNRKNPHVWGMFNLFDVTTNFKEIPDLIMHNAEAVLNFDDENVVFNLKKGKINGKDVNIDGLCNLSGKFNFNVSTLEQNMADFYKMIKTSTMIDGIKAMIEPIGYIDGLANLKLKVYGNIKDIYDAKFNENFFTSGSLDLLGNTVEAQGIKLNNVKGKINFENTNANLDINSQYGKSKISLKGLVKDNYLDTIINASYLNLSDIISIKDKFSSEIANIYINLSAKYKGRTDVIDYDKIDFEAQVLGISANNKLKLSNGVITIKNGKLQIKDINGSFDEFKSKFKVNLRVDNFITKPVYNGSIALTDFDLRIINLICEYGIIPQQVRDSINKISFQKGKINLDVKVSNNNVNTSTNIGGIEFVYTPLNIPLKVINGSLYVRKNYLGLNKINIMADEMPILIDGGINDIFDEQGFNLYINSKPKQYFIDKYINNNRIYPIKIKGDIVYWLRLKGTKNDFNIESETNLAKDSSIYYLGATVGDLENSIILNMDMNLLNQNLMKIKEFSYDKLISSQGKRQTRLNMLKASGGVDIIDNDLLFHDLKIKTSHPTDARIFNILFRKPNIKQGQFTSDLKFNGKISNPHITGTFHIVETNIPFFDTTMKNLSFVFKDKIVELSSFGEVLGNDIKFKGTFRNRLIPPYYLENADLKTKIIDINSLTNQFKSSQLSENNAIDSFADYDITNIVIKNLKLNAEEIKLRNLAAKDVEADISITDKKVFNINNFKLKLSDGVLDGRFSYNMQNNNTGITLNAKNINANDISVALFDLDNQIYGDLTGNLKLSCNGSEFKKCMETLNGDMKFNVRDGRMPKLGSLEYLLKAGNLLKGGITGLSINGVIDILTPLKTGNFSDIYGAMTIFNGQTNDIEISTKGKDLSIFLVGSYNFATSNAEMEVLGLLSKKISTMFGPLGNISLNTLFNVVPGVDLTKDSYLVSKINKIPGIELSSKAFRKFIAEINGNINGENYVRSFKWIN